MKKYLLHILFLGIVCTTQAQSHSRVLGNKSYEVSNHLGNVMTVVSDRKLATPDATATSVEYAETDVLSFNDYYPYGMGMDGRNGSGGYRFGFQGQEMDDEVKGDGNAVNYRYRVHDVRLGRFFAVDPLSEKYPFYSSYQFSGNKPINSIELEGLEEVNVSANFSFFLNGGFSISAGVGVQEVTRNTMTALNASITYQRGGPGTSYLSKNLLTIAYSPSFTVGAGKGETMNLNLFTDNSASVITNNFFSSFTVGGTMVFNASEHTGINNIFEWIGGAAARFSGVQVASYNDIFKFPFLGFDQDQHHSAGLNAQIKSNGNLLKYFFDLYYGRSDNKASFDEDRHIDGENYDNQSFYEMILNNGMTNLSYTHSNGSVLNSGYELGFTTFIPSSNAMHSIISSYSLFDDSDHHFHYLFVPYTSGGKLSWDRIHQYGLGSTKFLSKDQKSYLNKRNGRKEESSSIKN